MNNYFTTYDKAVDFLKQKISDGGVYVVNVEKVEMSIDGQEKVYWKAQW